MKLTRAKVAYDLESSPYRLSLKYPGQHIEYVFSSKLYMDKFKEKMGINRETINASLSNRFGFEVFTPLIADMKLYVTIEKRGFLIVVNGENVTCLNNIILSGVAVIMPRLSEL